jgi:hypothetical protein
MNVTSLTRWNNFVKKLSRKLKIKPSKTNECIFSLLSIEWLCHIQLRPLPFSSGSLIYKERLYYPRMAPSCQWPEAYGWTRQQMVQIYNIRPSFSQKPKIQSTNLQDFGQKKIQSTWTLALSTVYG